MTLRGVIGVPPDRDSVVAPQVAGRVSKVLVREGDKVTSGQLLATVDDPALEPALREASAGRAAARAALKNADAALARARRLLEEGIAPRRQVEDAQAQQASAAAALETADAHAALAQKQRDRRRVTAPIAGVVVHVLRRTGELVNGTPSTPVVEIADPATLELRADAPAADLVRVHPGSAVHIELDALPGQTLAGKVVFVSPAVEHRHLAGRGAGVHRPAARGRRRPAQARPGRPHDDRGTEQRQRGGGAGRGGAARR